jgi:hypothetical protein
MRLRIFLTSFSLFFLIYGTNAQSRIYVSGGITTTTGGSTGTTFASGSSLPCIDLEWEQKIVGSMSLLTGVSWLGAGYSNHNTAFGNKSVYSASYVGIPVLARWNQFNRHNFYLDFGILTSFLAKAHLQESGTRYGVPQTAEGDITSYCNRLMIGAKIQETVAFNRISLSFFFVIPFKGQSTVKDLQNHWPFNQQQSTYLLSNGYSDFALFGFKLGVRIK